MVVVDSLCTLLTLTEGSRLVSISLKTYIIKDIWSEKMVADFTFCEEAASRTEHGSEQEYRVAVLTAISELSTRRLEIYSIPDFIMLYALEVNETCYMMSFCGSLDDFWIVEGFSDNEETITELREAEKFAELFSLSVEEVHWNHLLFVLKDLSIRMTDASMDTDDELKLAHDACDLVKMLPDTIQVAKCCIETPFASVTVACKLLLFLQGYVSSAQNCDTEERETVLAKIAQLLNRVNTFRFLCDSDLKSDWFSFSQADLNPGDLCTLPR
ncbi:hypothetical protein MRX96_020980 [Rhipicephalus microplus]